MGDNKLKVLDKTQWVFNVCGHPASIFGVPETDVTVISPFVGGAFGSGLRSAPNVMLAAIALILNEIKQQTCENALCI